MDLLSREARLIVYCARAYIDATTILKIENLVYNNLNWATVLTLASRHRVTNLLYHTLHNTCPEAVPDEVFQLLKQEFHISTLNNIFFAQELIRILQLFAQNNIRAIAYKGPTLAISVYQNLTLRYFADLDILISQFDLVKAKNLLILEGYESLTVNDTQEADNINSDSERDFIRKDGKVVIDLHWRLTPNFFPFPVDFEDLWHRRQYISLLNNSIPTFCFDELLLILCVHGAKECWHKLYWICDISEIIKSNKINNWTNLISYSQKIHCKRMLLLGLLLAKELGGVNLPDEVSLEIEADVLVKPLAKEIIQDLFAEESALVALKVSWFRLRVRERLLERWQYIFCRVFAPNVRDRLFIKLPKPFYLLYYLIRPLRLILGKN